MLNGLLPAAAAWAVPDCRFSLTWGIWCGSDILEGARLAMELHLVAKSFSSSGADLEEGLQIVMPQYMDGEDD